MSLLFFNLSDSLHWIHFTSNLVKTRYHKTSAQGATYPTFPLSLTWAGRILPLISALPFKQSFGRNKNFPKVFSPHLPTFQLYLTANFRSGIHFLKLWNHLFFFFFFPCSGGKKKFFSPKRKGNRNILRLANGHYFVAPEKVRPSCPTLQTMITT